LRYFKALADQVFERETWGLIAAVLGNAKNRTRFKNIFWWDKDVGLSTYLAEVSGTPQVFEEINPETGTRTTRPPRIITTENPPRSQAEALHRWRQARATFLAALAESRAMLAAVEKIRVLVASLARFAREEAEAEAAASLAGAAVARSQAAAEEARAVHAGALAHLSSAEEQLAKHDRGAPNLLARLLRTRRAREWRSAREPFAAADRQARAEAASAAHRRTQEEKALDEATAHSRSADHIRVEAARRHREARREVEAWRTRLGDRFIDDAFWGKAHADKQKASPWLDAEQQRLRDNVFVAAMALHRAFIDAAAKPLRHN